MSRERIRDTYERPPEEKHPLEAPVMRLACHDNPIPKPSVHRSRADADSGQRCRREDTRPPRILREGDRSHTATRRLQESCRALLNLNLKNLCSEVGARTNVLAAGPPCEIGKVPKRLTCVNYLSTTD